MPIDHASGKSKNKGEPARFPRRSEAVYKNMKKKLLTIMAVLLSASLMACSSSKETTKKKTKKVSGKKTEAKSDDDDEDDPTEKTETKADEDVKDPDKGGNFSPDFTFEITTLDGQTITEDEFAAHKITMINFWEPWCGPCVNEMPDIQKLYENYKDKGLLVIGVFSSTDMMEEVNTTIADTGVKYPIAPYVRAFDQFQSGYVPTTIFVDENGHLLPVSNGYGDNIIVGSSSYDDWSKLIEQYLT